MAVLTQLIAFLLCTFSAWATIGAVRRNNDPGTVRLKLAALITAPLLLLLLTGTGLLTILSYYLAGFILIYTVIYGFAFILTAANYGLGTTLRAITNILNDGDAHKTQTETGRQGTGTQYTAEPPPDDPAEEPVIWRDQ